MWYRSRCVQKKEKPLLDWARGSGSLIFSSSSYFLYHLLEFIQLLLFASFVIKVFFFFLSCVVVAGQEQQQQQDPAVVAAATAAAAANALSALQREERSRVLRERQNEERQRKLEELKQHVMVTLNISSIFDRIHQRINSNVSLSFRLPLESHTHTLIGLFVFKC